VWPSPLWAWSKPPLRSLSKVRAADRTSADWLFYLLLRLCGQLFLWGPNCRLMTVNVGADVCSSSFVFVESFFPYLSVCVSVALSDCVSVTMELCRLPRLSFVLSLYWSQFPLKWSIHSHLGRPTQSPYFKEANNKTLFCLYLLVTTGITLAISLNSQLWPGRFYNTTFLFICGYGLLTAQ